MCWVDGESDEELVFENDTLTWGAVARTYGVRESSKQTKATTSKVDQRVLLLHQMQFIWLMKKRHFEETEEDAEEYKSGGEDVRMLTCLWLMLKMIFKFFVGWLNDFLFLTFFGYIL